MTKPFFSAVVGLMLLAAGGVASQLWVIKGSLYTLKAQNASTRRLYSRLWQTNNAQDDRLDDVSAVAQENRLQISVLDSRLGGEKRTGP